MNDIVSNYISCHAELDANQDYVERVTLNHTIMDDESVVLTAATEDYMLLTDLCKVFRDAAEYRRVFDEMRHAGMGFKMGGPLGMDIAATVLEMWREYRAALDNRPPIVRTEAEWEAMSEKREAEAEKSKQALKELLG